MMRCSNSLEIKNETTLRFHFILFRLAKIRKIDNAKCRLGVCNSIDPAGRSGADILESNRHFLMKLRIYIPDATSYIPTYLSQRNCHATTYGNRNKSVYHSLVCVDW